VTHPLSAADGARQFREPGIQSGAGLASYRSITQKVNMYAVSTAAPAHEAIWIQSIAKAMAETFTS